MKGFTMIYRSESDEVMRRNVLASDKMEAVSFFKESNEECELITVLTFEDISEIRRDIMEMAINSGTYLDVSTR